MRLLLDTHALIWLLSDDPRLGPRVRAILAAPDIYRAVSVISLWEVLLKSGRGKLRADPDAVAAAVTGSGFPVLDLAMAHVLAAARLPRFPDHGDPFDRMLIAQARAENLTLLTVDAKLARYGVATLGCD